jgi:hypothetical protein
MGKPGGPAGRVGATTLPERPGWPDGTGAPDPGIGSAIWAGAIPGARAAAKARQNVASVERPVMRNPNPAAELEVIDAELEPGRSFTSQFYSF